VIAVRSEYPFEIVTGVVLPVHLHATWALPEQGRHFAARWTLSKQKLFVCVPPGVRVFTSRAQKM
jgi:REP element-mobilizing transposase RayT